MANKLQNMPLSVHRQIYTSELAPARFHEPYAKAYINNKSKNRRAHLKWLLVLTNLKYKESFFREILYKYLSTL